MAVPASKGERTVEKSKAFGDESQTENHQAARAALGLEIEIDSSSRKIDPIRKANGNRSEAHTTKIAIKTKASLKGRATRRCWVQLVPRERNQREDRSQANESERLEQRFGGTEHIRQPILVTAAKNRYTSSRRETERR
jgi:hypothetical protein